MGDVHWRDAGPQTRSGESTNLQPEILYLMFIYIGNVAETFCYANEKCAYR